ncbi:MAG TPA: DUF1206 domain-containing protein [Pseudorhizobium sp.]|jgi:hypothetical protein|nr:DUF1206 domain-containing protein [Pseudorhizobium sp.]
MPDQVRFEWLARIGYSARGIVYILVGAMALLSSFGGRQTDQESALQIVLNQPFGWIWLALIGVGLIGFIVWRLAQGILNADDHPHNAKGYLIRIAMLISAATYTGLASFALRHALQLSIGGGSGNSRESWTSWLMQQPFGPYLVAIVGLAIIGGGVAQLVKGVKRRYLKYVSISPERNRVLDLICVYGLTARGVIFFIIGGFFLYAAWAVDPSQAGSTAQAMDWVRQLPFGGILYGLIALGLFAFGAYGLIEARYRIVETPALSDAKRPLKA